MEHKDVPVIWEDYPKNLHEWLLRLTEVFDLTFPLESEKVNIVPSLLPQKEPKVRVHYYTIHLSIVTPLHTSYLPYITRFILYTFIPPPALCEKGVRKYYYCVIFLCQECEKSAYTDSADLVADFVFLF